MGNNGRLFGWWRLFSFGDEEGGGRLSPPEHFNPEGGPRRALARGGTAAKARYEHHPQGPTPSRAKRLGMGEEAQRRE